MSKFLICFLKNESGASAIEHGVIAGSFALAIVVVGQGVGMSFGNILVPISSGPFSCPRI
jgi:Flp pilus assembly pilin Flp